MQIATAISDHSVRGEEYSPVIIIHGPYWFTLNIYEVFFFTL